jgi:putative transcriptional regulator
MKNKILKNNIRILRAERKISQEVLAKSVAVSRQTINAIENEKYDPSCHLALRIANYFQIDFSKVFWLEEKIL